MIINVVAALIKKDNKVLIAKRSTGDPHNIGKWEFPGGKVKENETEKHAIEREIKEEFDVIIKVKEYVTTAIYTYPNKKIILKLYETEYVSGKFKLNDHSEYKWVVVDNLLNYDLTEADVELSKYLKNSNYNR